jgi:pSer/pThr/pTyr-binding forkhead associated (FHA) protein
MKIDISTRKILTPFFLILALHGAQASAEPERELQLKSVERDGENHIKMRFSAFEKDSEKKYPITTLDKNSFQIFLNGNRLQNPNLSLTTFDTTRRWNNRAVVWIYDATGVKSIKGLTRELRTLTAQEFPQFQADYLAIFGVAAGKTIERVLLDPIRQENITALQRQLSADPSGTNPNLISRDPSVCIAAQKFSQWSKQGLKTTDQKHLILMGGSGLLSAAEKLKIDECTQQLIQQNVSVQQIVFSRMENFSKRTWLDHPEVAKAGSNFRVVDLPGASRAIQTLRTSLDHEYVLTAQLPENSASLAYQLTLHAKYHGATFRSESVVISQSPAQRSTSVPPVQIKNVLQPPQRLIPLTRQSALAFDAWLEWLATSFLIGIAVTIRHMNRLNSGITQVPENELGGDVSQGPLLVVLNGRDRGREYRIRQNSTLLGKGWGCDVRLQSLNVKRKHGRLEIQGDKAVLQDLSEGELFVNGRPIRSVRVIGHGSVIRLGDLQLLFQCGES